LAVCIGEDANRRNGRDIYRWISVDQPKSNSFL